MVDSIHLGRVLCCRHAYFQFHNGSHSHRTVCLGRPHMLYSGYEQNVGFQVVRELEIKEDSDVEGNDRA